MTSIPITLRLAREQDALILNEIGRQSYIHHFFTVWNNKNELFEYLNQEYSTDKIIYDIGQPNTEWYVIESEFPIGLVKLTHQEKISDTQLAGTLLNKLYFLPAATGKGYGKLVFKLIENIAISKGSNTLWLDVLASNSRAIQLYQSNGLQIFKEILFKSKSQQTLEYIMYKTL
ncbi:GNAT family N-acetyltransferase [Providencia vermicola]|uniref:GNAT family N-acetyltransferase n=1 Tax=Providencia vermicola TaxID=333965 RepID=UPI003D2CDDD9